MKRNHSLSLLILIPALALAGAGCGSLLQKKIPEQSLPVISAAASTNDSQLVAWLKYAQLVNDRMPTTPAQPLTAAALGAAIAIGSGLSGWMARHKGQNDPPKPTV